MIPRIKNEIEENTYMEIPKTVTVNTEYGEKACMAFKCFMPYLAIKNLSEDAIITANRVDFKKEGYLITVKNDKIVIEYSDYKGLINALSTISQSIEKRDNGYFLRCGTKEDYPSSQHRGILLDLARGIRDFEALKNDIILIAKCKMNYLHLHLADNSGICFKMDCLPDSLCIENAYTKAQIKELCDLSDVLGLEVIPEFDMPAHSERLIKSDNELACRKDDGIDDSKWVICTGTEKTYKIYEEIIREITDLVPGKFFHMGGDELEFADIKAENKVCRWDLCQKCREFRKKHSISDMRGQYYYFVERINEIAKSCNRQLIMWSDQIDCLNPDRLPKDIIMQFWRIAAPGRGPVEGCSMKAQLGMGYTMINSYFPYTYIEEEGHMSPDIFKKWRWDIIPETAPEYAKNIIGTEVCAWEYGNTKYHYDRVLPSAIALMADKQWNADFIGYNDDYMMSLTKTVLGCEAEEDLNIFSCFGDIIPPRDDKEAYFDKITITKEQMKQIKSSLEKTGFLEGDRERADIYINCIDKIIEEITDR